MNENKLKVCIIPAMTSTSVKTQPPELDITSALRPGIWSFRVATISDSWTEAPFVHTTFNAKLWQNIPLFVLFHMYARLHCCFLKSFQPTRIFQLATQEI